MATYLSASEMADYNDSMIENTNYGGHTNISDRGDYDYDYNSWIHYGDYWIKPDGTISLVPPVQPPAESTPASTPVVDEYRRDYNVGNEGSSQTGWALGGTRDSTPIGSLSFNETSPWGGYFADQYSQEYGPLVQSMMGFGSKVAAGLGLSPTSALEALSAQALLGPGIGSMYTNVAPFAKDALRDWMDSRNYESVLDTVESNLSGYGLERTAGSAYTNMQNTFNKLDKSPYVGMVEFAAPAMAAVSQYGSLNPSALGDYSAASTQAIADAIAASQGLGQYAGKRDPLSSLMEAYNFSTGKMFGPLTQESLLVDALTPTQVRDNIMANMKAYEQQEIQKRAALAAEQAAAAVKAAQAAQAAQVAQAAAEKAVSNAASAAKQSNKNTGGSSTGAIGGGAGGGGSSGKDKSGGMSGSSSGKDKSSNKN